MSLGQPVWRFGEGYCGAVSSKAQAAMVAFGAEREKLGFQACFEAWGKGKLSYILAHMVVRRREVGLGVEHNLRRPWKHEGQAGMSSPLGGSGKGEQPPRFEPVRRLGERGIALSI